MASMSEDADDPNRVLGYLDIESIDVASIVASMRPGESVRIRPGDLRRRVPLLAVEDDSWRSGVEP